MMHRNVSGLYPDLSLNIIVVYVIFRSAHEWSSSGSRNRFNNREGTGGEWRPSESTSIEFINNLKSSNPIEIDAKCRPP